MVEVLDINDNAPEFGQPEYSFTVTEVRPLHTVMLKMLRRNAQIYFFHCRIDQVELKLLNYVLMTGTADKTN